MSRTVTIGTDSYLIPDEGENPPWGEDLVEYLVRISTALANVENVADILPTTAVLANGQATFANIAGFSFDTSQVIKISAEYFCKRIYDSGATTIVESGEISGHFDGTDFIISQQTTGDVGLTIDVTAAGVFQYKTTSLANHTSSELTFKAKTILD